MNENLDRENHLPQQIFPLSTLSMLLCHQKGPDEYSIISDNLELWRRGRGKHLCDLVSVSMQRN